MKILLPGMYLYSLLVVVDLQTYRIPQLTDNVQCTVYSTRTSPSLRVDNKMPSMHGTLYRYKDKNSEYW